MLPKTLSSAAQRSGAYAELLRDADVSAERLGSPDGVRHAPVLDKQNTFERFPIQQLLAKDVRRDTLASILTSSGYGAASFGFGISDRQEKARTPEAIDLGLQNAFGVDDHRTLLINTLPMGVVFESAAACVSNVSVREDMALAILGQAGPLFDQVVLVVDPLFCKRLLDHAAEQEFDFSRQRIHMVIGEETFQEPFRDYLRRSLGLGEEDPDPPFLGSSMGVGELGLNLFFETPETVAMRRSLFQQNPWRRQPMLFCFNPLRSWVEVHDPGQDGIGELLITMQDKRATIPLPRYRTGDRVSWLGEGDFERVPAEIADALRRLPFPVVAVHGRDRDQLDPAWHVDDLKSLQYRDPDIAQNLTGAFRATVESGRLHWHLQAGRHLSIDAADIERRLQALCLQRCDALGLGGDCIGPVRVFSFSEFPYDMNLDYERKFRYGGQLAQDPAV